MEALTITPDQSTLVGIMESSMDNPDKSGRVSSFDAHRHYQSILWSNSTVFIVSIMLTM
ncbi:hypothetical protein [Psychrobacter sp. WY6]|uniref:hypothetical protein n=1 Tax=Psychrobacter sp. WY6 TaxID=2708350 RepID=UPI0024DEAFFE|nr:hypothetical protein [Psychrobacter sp. WY6]